jgi:hypothetical protein
MTDFNQNQNVSTNYGKNQEYEISRESVRRQSLHPCGQADMTRLILALASHCCCVDASRNAYLGMYEYTSQNGRRLALVRVSVQQESTVVYEGCDRQVSQYVCTQELKKIYTYCSWQQSMRGYIESLKIIQ